LAVVHRSDGCLFHFFVLVVRDGLVDQPAVGTIFGRQCHDRIVDVGRDRQIAIEGLPCPFSPKIKGVFHRTILYFFAALRRGSRSFFGPLFFRALSKAT
jgi:hypothetical protein